MRPTRSIVGTLGLAVLLGVSSTAALAQDDATASRIPPDTARNPDITRMVSRLELEKYKATVKGLTQFGDRRQGTKRNRDAVDWIEAQLKSYGCTNTERITYIYTTPQRGGGRGGAAADTTGGRGGGGRGGRGTDSTGRAGGRGAGGDSTGRGGGGRGARAGNFISAGWGMLHGVVTRTGVNTDSLKQTDLKLRALNAEPAKDGERQEVFCTKVGTTHPEEMYIVGGHMDGHGWGEAANDDGSGHRARHGARAHLQHAGRNDGPVDPLHPLEQRRDRHERRARIHPAALGAAGQGESGGIGQVSGAEMARDDSARHDDVRPRHAEPRRHDAEGSSAPKPT